MLKKKKKQQKLKGTSYAFWWKKSKNWLFCKAYPLCFFVKKTRKSFLFHTQKICLFLIEKHRGYPFQNLELLLSPTMNIFAFIPRAKWWFPDFRNCNSLDNLSSKKKYCLIMLVCLLCKFVLRLEKCML